MPSSSASSCASEESGSCLASSFLIALRRSACVFCTVSVSPPSEAIESVAVPGVAGPLTSEISEETSAKIALKASGSANRSLA